MKKMRKWAKRTSTHKIITTLVYMACIIATVVVFIGWFSGLQDAVGMMNCIAMVIIANTLQYAGKAGFEHSKLATPLMAGVAAGLSSNNPVAGVSSSISTYESEKQMEQMNQQMEQQNASTPAAVDSNIPETLPDNTSSQDTK